MPDLVFGRYGFRLRPFTTLLMIAFVALTVTLGRWQSGRAEEKRQLQERLDALAAAPPDALPLVPMSGEGLVQHRMASRGRFEGQTFLVDNRVYKNVPGYHVVTAFCPAEGKVCVLVNRGWIAAGARRDVLPKVDPPQGLVELAGIVVMPPTSAYELAPESESGPVIQHVIVERLARRTRLPLQPFIILQSGDGSDGLVRDWPRPDAGINTHKAYAVQWYAMALIGFLLWAGLNLRRQPKENPR